MTMRVLGIMSGTSIDAADFVVCEIGRGGQMRLEDHWQVPFPRSLRQRLQTSARNEALVHEAAQLHHDLGRFYATGAGRIRVDLAGMHGQTVFHHGGRRAPATLQIGEPAYLAERLGIPVVSNFRAADLAAGGQGAPLATIFHRQIFAKKNLHVAVNNLGGISNVTSIDGRLAKQPRMLAFDTGPGNMLVDLAMQRYSKGRLAFDRGGTVGLRGRIHPESVTQWLKHRYFKMPPPKSTGRELFGERFLEECLRSMHGLSWPDRVATLTEFTARSMASSYREYLPSIPDRVILCGGGAKNPFFVSRIAGALGELKSGIEVSSSSEYGWDPSVIEGAAFALLAWRRWQNIPGNIPETTGATGERVLGEITEPRGSHNRRL